MTGINKYEFSLEDCSKIMNFARNALETYVTEGQRMDVGSVDDVLNKRAGILIQIESSNGFKRLRGSSGIYDGRRIADAIIDATIYAASSRSIGSEIHKSEFDDLIFKISIIEEVKITDNPVDELKIGNECPIIPTDIDHWLYPTKAAEQGWTPKEYIDRTFRTSDKNRADYDDKIMAIINTKSIVEQNPNGKTIIDNIE